MTVDSYGKVPSQDDDIAIVNNSLLSESSSHGIGVITSQVFEVGNRIPIRFTYKKFVMPLIVLFVSICILSLLAQLRMKYYFPTAPNEASISNRASTKYLSSGLPYLTDWLAAVSNQYSSENLDGKLPLAVAENKLMQDELNTKLRTLCNYSNEVFNYAVSIL